MRDFHNIENRDALIDYDSRSELLDDNDQLVTIWDGLTMKTSPVTGELIPDESARTPVYQYHNPKQAQWPEADYIIGNPPFIGNKRMRTALGDGYTVAVRNAFSIKVPDSSDFVMYWFFLAGSQNSAKSIGFISTNSITQEFNRRVLDKLISDRKYHINFAIPDHPWVEATDGADVRIAMTVLRKGAFKGTLRVVIEEEDNPSTPEKAITFNSRFGDISAKLVCDLDFSSCKKLVANGSISNRGMIPHGEAFLVQSDEEYSFDDGALLRPYMNNRDLMAHSRNVRVIDTHDLSESELKQNYPETWQWLNARSKPVRAENKRKSVREKWWLFAEPRKVFRAANTGLSHYLVTGQTGKHRVFSILNSHTLPDDKLVAISTDKSFHLGIMSSRTHACWSLATGGRMGVGNDPVYVKSDCFEKYPFPDPSLSQKARISQLAEQINKHRKTQQAAHNKLPLTGVYNVLEKLRKQEPLTAKEKTIYDQGLVGVLLELHDDLDRAVFDAYGWNDLADKLVGLPGATTPYPEKSEAQAETEEELLKRLVALNHQRAAEEGKGQIRWLRPEYQNPDYNKDKLSAYDSTSQVEADVTVAPIATKAKKLIWPKVMLEQIAGVKDALQKGHSTAEAITALYKSPKTTLSKVQEALESLASLGLVSHSDNQYKLVD